MRFGPEKGGWQRNGAVAAAAVGDTKRPCPGCLHDYISCPESGPFSGLDYISLKLQSCTPLALPPLLPSFAHYWSTRKLEIFDNLVPLGASPVSDPLQDDGEQERSDPGRGDMAISRR